MKKSIILVGILCGSVFPWTWSEPVLIANYGASELLIDNHGVCWAVCGAFYRYDDGTSEWQKVTECNYGGSTACFDKSDTLWVFNGNLYVRYDGQNWSGVDTMPAFPDGNIGARVTADSTSGVWACWLWWYDVAYNRYKDGQWDEPKLVPDTVPGQDWTGWAVATDALGRVWFGWQVLGEKDNFFECRHNDNGIWSDQMSVRVINAQYGIGSIDFAPDREGGIWTVWYTYRFDEHETNFVEARHYKGGVWGSIDTIANAGSFSDKGYPSMARIAVDSYGRAWAVWHQALVPHDGCGDIYYSFNAGQGWSTPAPVDTDPAVDHLPDIAVDGAGRVWCVWSSSRGDSTGVWASYATGAGIEEQPKTQTVTFDVQSFTTNPKVFYSLPAGQSGTISIYDVAGKRVESRKVQNSGEVRFPSNMPSGVYFVRMHSDEFEASERVVLLK